MKAFSVVHSLFVWVASLTAGFVIMLPIGLIFLPFARHRGRYSHAWLQAWARLMIKWFCWLDIAIEDEERVRQLLAEGPVLIAVNHQSMMDMFVLLAMI